MSISRTFAFSVVFEIFKRDRGHTSHILCCIAHGRNSRTSVHANLQRLLSHGCGESVPECASRRIGKSVFITEFNCVVKQDSAKCVCMFIQSISPSV